MILSARYLAASFTLMLLELTIALYERAEPLSPAFSRVPELKSRRRELLAAMREMEDEQ